MLRAPQLTIDMNSEEFRTAAHAAIDESQICPNIRLYQALS